MLPFRKIAGNRERSGQGIVIIEEAYARVNATTRHGLGNVHDLRVQIL